MRAIEIFRKNGYKQRCNDSRVMIYDLKKSEKYADLPDTILFSKGIKSVDNIEFISNEPEQKMFLGTVSFCMSAEMIQAVHKQIYEIEEKLNKKWSER